MSAGSSLLASSQPLQERFDLALTDLDGVCYRGPSLVPHADAALAAARAAGMRLRFVTNNANRTPAAVAEHLTRLGIGTAPEEVVTSAQAAAAVLAEDLPAGAPVLVVGGEGLRQAVRDAGLRPVASAHDSPATVVQGFAPEVGWPQLAEAVYAIRAGAAYVATNLDATIPTERGITLGNGSLVAAVRTATGVEPRSVGKPQPVIFERATAQAGARRPLVVGDRLDTDLAGARAAGIPGMHVLTGVDDARDVLLAPPEQRPAFLAIDLRDLAKPHPAPIRDGGWWVCGQAGARVTDGLLELRPEAAPAAPDGRSRTEETWTLSLDAWRAAAAAAWEATDARRPLRACPRLHVQAER